MARIRSVKPSFFRHLELFEAERDTGLPIRLAFAGLWTTCDREGRFKWKPEELKLDCLPYDQVDFAAILDVLADRGFVVRYSENGRNYGVIPTWKQHQQINHREAESVIPAPNPGKSMGVPMPEQGHARGEGKGMEGNGMEGNGGGVRACARGADAPAVAVAAPLVMSPKRFEQRRRQCAFVGSRLDVPTTAHETFRRSLGGADPESELQAWYLEINTAADLSGEPVPSGRDIFPWLQKRFDAWVKDRTCGKSALAAWAKELEQKNRERRRTQ